MLSVGRTSCIAISSMQENSFFDNLLEAKKSDGTPVFDTVKISNQCRKCDAMYARMNKSNLRLKKPLCKHAEQIVPSWQDKDQLSLMKDVYEQSGNAAIYQREMCGVATSTINSAYDPSRVDEMVFGPRYRDTVKPDFIIMAVDPNMGGTSETAVVSTYFHNNNMVICGLDSRATPDMEKNAFLLSHIQALRMRGNGRFSTSKIVFLPENNVNGAMFSTLSAFAGNNLKNVVCVMGPDKKEGATTVPWSKIKYTRVAQNLLSNHRVFIDIDLVCSAYETRDARTLEGLLIEFASQLKQWKINMKNTNNEKYYVTCTGKTDISGNTIAGKNDDLAMAFTLASWGIRKYDHKTNTLLTDRLVYEEN